MTHKWTHDPRNGAEFVTPRRDEIISELERSADLTFMALDDLEKERLQKVKAEFGVLRGKVEKAVNKARTTSPVLLVRKHWNRDREDMWRYYLDRFLREAGAKDDND